MKITRTEVEVRYESNPEFIRKISINDTNLRMANYFSLKHRQILKQYRSSALLKRCLIKDGRKVIQHIFDTSAIYKRINYIKSIIRYCRYVWHARTDKCIPKCINIVKPEIEKEEKITT